MSARLAPCGDWPAWRLVLTTLRRMMTALRAAQPARWLARADAHTTRLFIAQHEFLEPVFVPELSRPVMALSLMHHSLQTTAFAMRSISQALRGAYTHIARSNLQLYAQLLNACRPSNARSQ